MLVTLNICSSQNEMFEKLFIYIHTLLFSFNIICIYLFFRRLVLCIFQFILFPNLSLSLNGEIHQHAATVLLIFVFWRWKTQTFTPHFLLSIAFLIFKHTKNTENEYMWASCCAQSLLTKSRQKCILQLREMKLKKVKTTYHPLIFCNWKT